MNKIEELIKAILAEQTTEHRNNQIDKIINNGLNQTDLENFKKEINNAVGASILNSDFDRIFLDGIFKKYGIT